MNEVSDGLSLHFSSAALAFLSFLTLLSLGLFLLKIVDISINLNRLDSEVQLWNFGCLWLSCGVDLDFFSKGNLRDLFLDVDNLLNKRLSGFYLFNDGFLVVE